MEKKLTKDEAKPLNFAKEKEKFIKITICLLMIIMLKNRVFFFLSNIPSINCAKMEKI